MKKVEYINRRISKTIYLGYFFLIVMTSCKHVQNMEDHYGSKYNVERKKIGLILLNSQCLSFHKERDRIWWNPKNLDSLKNTANAFYGGKTIHLENDTLISEADIFVGPESFTKPEQYVELYYIYYYKPYEMFSTGWMYQVVKRIGENERGMLCSANYITRNEADSILYSWGLRY